MKWVANSKDPVKILDAIKQGLVMGRPQPEGTCTREMLEAVGWFGFYDPYAIESRPMTVGGSVSIMIDGNQIKEQLNGAGFLGPIKGIGLSLREALLNGTKEPTSDLDDRIKELKKDKNNPKKYRARWTGTKYVYDPIK